MQVVHLPGLLLCMVWLLAEPQALLESWHFHLLSALGFIAAWMRWRSERGTCWSCLASRLRLLAGKRGVERAPLSSTRWAGRRWPVLGVMSVCRIRAGRDQDPLGRPGAGCSPPRHLGATELLLPADAWLATSPGSGVTWQDERSRRPSRSPAAACGWAETIYPDRP